MLAQYRALPQSNLHRALKRARRAWWDAAVRRTLLVSIGVAGLAVVATWFWSLLAGEAGPLFAALSVQNRAGGAALIAFLSTFVALTAWHGLRSPSLLELARRADHGQRQMQALSTAWEVLNAGAAPNVVVRKLVEDAEARSQTLDVRPRQARPGAWRLAVVACLALATVAILVPVPERSIRSSADGTVQGAEATWTEDQLATLEDVARLLDLSAQRSDDQYLGAIAASFAELATDARSGAVTRSGADAAVRDLLTHLSAATAGSGSNLATAVERAMARAPGSAAARTPVTDDGAAANSPAATPTSGDAPVETQPANADESASLYMALRSMIDELEDGGGMGLRSTRPTADSQAVDDSFYGGVGRAQTDPNAASPAGPLARAEGAGDPAGAAQRSSEGAGDAAGAGAASLPAFDPTAAVQAAAVAESLLPRNETTEGRRVEVEMIPQAGEGLTPAADQVSVPAFVRSHEAAIVARGVGAEHGGVVSRYFTPDSSTADGTP